jgi:choline dehydrogenase-like flavoprotein
MPSGAYLMNSSSPSIRDRDLLIDLNLSRQRRFEADICLVGTGAAGLTLASVLRASGASVMMLESGGMEQEEEAQRLNRCEADLVLFEGAHRGRTRMFGGSTACWGGQLLPLEPIDFVERPWVDHSGWPIKSADMTPYYRRASRFAGVDDLNFDSDVCRALGRESPFDARAIRYFFSKWSPHPRFRDLLGDELERSEHIRVFLHANATHLELGDGGRRVTEVRAANALLKDFVFTANIVVLCAGGIETPRLLLRSTRQAPRGIGNAHGKVGRFFHDHPSLVVGTVRGSDSTALRDLFGSSALDGFEVSPRMALPASLQETYGLLNASAYISFRYPPTLLRRAMILNLARRVGTEHGAARDLVDAFLLLLGPTLRLHHQGARLGKAAQFTVTVVTEQEPCAESRISLANDTDRFGVPRARISWHATYKTWETVKRFSLALREEFYRTGLGKLELFPHITADRAYWRVFPHDLYHHMGATRMGTSPETGVVDDNCRVFGVDNLFIASSSVFPTGGHSNCTLTIIALALRLGEHLGLARS